MITGVDLFMAMITLLCIVSCFALGYFVALSRAKHFVIKKAAEWVYSVAPRHIAQVPGELYYKMSVEGLRAFEERMAEVELPEEKLIKKKK